MKYFYDPVTGLYARAWKMRKGMRIEIRRTNLEWKELHRLRKNVRDRIALLNLADAGPTVPGLGSHRDSKLMPYHMYFFLDDTGESE